MINESLIEKVFASGSRIIIEYVDEKGAIKNCGTTVEDLEGQYLVLQTPIINNSPVTFRESQELTLRRLDEQTEEAFVTNVFVIDIRREKIPLLVCSKPEKIDRTSLRRFARFDVDLPLNLSTDKGGTVRDISLSGCYAIFPADSPVRAKQELQLKVTIPGEAELDLLGKIIRIDLSGQDQQKGAAIEFVNLSDSDRETLYNYIFQLQLTADSILNINPKKK